MPLENTITVTELLLAAGVVGIFIVMVYMQAVSVIPRNKDARFVKKYFIIVLGYYIGRFYREIGRDILQTLDSLGSYLSTAYDRDISEKVCESLIFQQGRVVRPDFGEKYLKELPHKLRLQTLIILFKLAKHEGLTDKKTAEILRAISQEIFINPIIFEKTKAKEFPSEPQSGTFSIRQSEKALKDAADLLEVSYNASDYDVKKAYRRMAKKYHPDVNTAASPDLFIRMKQAYDLLKQHRGFH